MHPKILNRSLLLGCALSVLITGTAFAIPALQLDIGGGVYDPITETVIAQSNSFTLYAYLIPSDKALLSESYYISAALVPKTGPTDLPISTGGSFTINGTPVTVTQGMEYGIPPLESNLSKDTGDLEKHGIFLTFFKEFGFEFSSGNTTTPYNTQEHPGSGPTASSGSMYYTAFSVDTTGLAAGYAIHFDLYSAYARTHSDIDIDQFAPFSHDAQSGNPGTPVPEPGTMILLGTGLVGLAGYGRKRFHK